MKPQGFVPASSAPDAREPADLHIKKVVRVAGILIGTLVGSILALVLFFHHLNHEYPGRTSEAAPLVAPAELPPAPRLQTTPLRDLEMVRELENSHLDRYGWIDRQHGVAQIPIDRAMALWVSRSSVVPESASTDPSSTNNAPLTGTTELQMRQQKAEEVPHVP